MVARLSKLRQALADHRQLLLFGMLVATIAIGPLLTFLDSGRILLNLCLGLTLLVTTMAPMEDRARGHTFTAIVGLAIVLGLAPLGTPLGQPGPIMLGVWSLIALVAAARTFRYALSTQQVSTSHLLAALNAYLLVGVFLGAIWVALEQGMPGSLLTGGNRVPDFGLPDGIYFSFVTLATLGYGDITPVTPIARGLAVFEAVFGQLYLAVLVARLVSQRIAGQTGAPP